MIIQKGTFIIGTLVLKSNVKLVLTEGACLKGSTIKDDYKLYRIKIDVYSDTLRAFLIYADHAHDISIEGKGCIDGSGAAFWEPFDILPRWIKPLKGRVSNLVELHNVQNLVITGITFKNSPEWTCHLFNCSSVLIDSVRIRNNLYVPNNDGIDLSGCSNVLMKNCDIITCDDAVCVKTFPSSNESFNITVENCILQTTCAALKIGESYRNISSVFFKNCLVTKSSRAIGIYGNYGGEIEHIEISDITSDTNAPLVLNRPIQIGVWKSKDGKIGSIRNVSIRNFKTKTEGRILITADDGGIIENITLRNISMEFPLIENPELYARGVTSDQLAAVSYEARKAKATVVLSNIKSISIDSLNIKWPGKETIPTEWLLLERIENGSLRVHKPDYQTYKNKTFDALWSSNVQQGVFNAIAPQP